MFHVFYIFILFLLYGAQCSTAEDDTTVATANKVSQNITDSRARHTPEADLIKHLLRDYDADARPVSDPGKPILVKLGLYLNTILNLVRISSYLLDLFVSPTNVQNKCKLNKFSTGCQTQPSISAWYRKNGGCQR